MTEELFAIIGRMYVDIYNAQKVIDMLQKQIKDKDNELIALKTPKNSDE